MTLFNFNCNEAPEPESFEPFTTEAPMQITESEVGSPNEKGTVQLMLKFQVLDGVFKGRTIMDWFTVKCANQKATDIGMRQLRMICEAVGLTGFTQTEELHNKPMIGRTKIVDNYTKIKSVKPIGQAAAPATPPPVQQTEPTQPGETTAPWKV